MKQLSSSFTLFFTIFIPVCWFTFFGILNLMLWITDADDISDYHATTIRAIALGIFIIFGLFIYFTLMRLRRVEMENNQLFITNYFKTIQIDIAHIVKAELHYNKLAIIHLDRETFFGKKIHFLSNAERFSLLNSQLQ